ncbi:MAG: hypothetical protein MI924_08445 [Chloroflexales bacterium]|nr:hypothetical protein [Chloroflexales bacterium]
MLWAELHRDGDRRREPRELLAGVIDRVEEEGFQAAAKADDVRRHRPPRRAGFGGGDQAQGQFLGGGIGRDGDRNGPIGAAQRHGRTGGKRHRGGRDAGCRPKTRGCWHGGRGIRRRRCGAIDWGWICRRCLL